MSHASNEGEEMRSEYDIRGGVRGKYFERYHDQEPRVAIEDSPFITTSTVGAPDLGSVIWSSSYPPPPPSPVIQVGALRPSASGQ